MNSSVKFFEPTVMVVPPFCGLLLITLPESVLPVLELELSSLLSSPHAATSTAQTSTAMAASRARTVLRVIRETSLPRGLETTRREAYPVPKSRKEGSGRAQATRGNRALHQRQQALHREGQQGDEDGAGEPSRV